MYEQHFGLEKRPFSVKATGTEVFVGPQTAKTMAGFRKALAVQDAVVTVSGAAGTGKTTLVERALDAIGSKYKTIRVGRVQMNASDVLESLLIVLGVADRPTGTIQRFTALRKKLKELQDAETRVFIVVEDALRAGTDTLAELEALTVADAGESDGASIVLMGDERLFDFMKEPALAQLQQRIRQRHRIKPLCLAEFRGYLKHSLRMAGGDFDQIFDGRSAELVHVLSAGIPRVANTLVDAVLVAAATQSTQQITAKMVAEVASDEFGLNTEDFDFSAPAETDTPSAGVEPDDTGDPAHVEEATPADAADASTPAADNISEPDAIAEIDGPAPTAQEADEPELPTLFDEAAPAVPTEASAPAADLVTEPEPVAEVADEPELPTLSDEAAAVSAADVPEPAADTVAEPAQKADQESAETPEPVIVFAEDEQGNPEASVDIPHLIQDTLPDLAILSRRYETLAESYEEEAREPTTEQVDEAIPELVPEPSAAPVDQEIPELTAETTATDKTEGAQEPVLSAAETPESVADPVAIAEPLPADTPGSDTDPNWQLTEEPEFQMVTEVVPALEEDSTQESHAGPDALPELQDGRDVDNIPELQLDSEVETENVPQAPPETAAELPPEAEALPDLELDEPSSAEPLPESAAAEIPEWERDPTLAQLKPDLDALEQAMAFTHSEEPPVVEKTADIEPEKLAAEVADPEEIPEIILDKAIETGIGELDIEEPSDILPPVPEQKTDPEIDRIAADIANATSLEDIDDIMAETLFGSGISMIAEQVIANPPSEGSANDELKLANETPASPAPAATVNAAAVTENKTAPTYSDITEEISIETQSAGANSGLDLSASMRLKTVRALNADLHPSLREPGNDEKVKRSSASHAPEPIEDQINTSITQTLKTLKLPPEAEIDEPDEAPKKGFLSRFRRS